jgi:hypothetical protein
MDDHLASSMIGGVDHVADRTALHRDQSIHLIGAVGCRRHPHPVADIDVAQGGFGCWCCDGVAFVDDDLPVLLQHAGVRVPMRDGLHHDQVHDAAPFPSPRPELTNLLLSQAEELLESFAPLGEQFGTVHEDRRWRRAFGDEGLHVLQEILGHASIETTRGYLHPDDRHLASAAEQANAFLSRGARPNSSGRPRQGTVREL